VSGGTVRRVVVRVLALGVTGVGLYIVAPSLLSLFDAWPSLGEVEPWWFAVVTLLELGSFCCLWLLLRIALGTQRWFDVVTSQLAGNAASRIIPGGAASGGVVQAGMLIGSGFPPGTVGAVLSATGLLTFGMLLALPLLTVPALLAGLPIPDQLELGLVVSVGLAVALVAGGFAALTWDRMVHAVSAGIGAAVVLVHRRARRDVVAARLVAERDQIRAAFHRRWIRSLAGAAGNRVLDFAALICSLLAVGADARPSLVLLAYVASVALALIPVTPGGLGFVEAGLTSLLVVAGADADQAVVATLLYRLVSYWLPIVVGALAYAIWRARPHLWPAAECPPSV
jgi:uncharacterized protein (TIRG00374 family)